MPIKIKKLPARFGRRYPWESWFRRGRFRAVRGQDYTCRTSSMAQMIRTAAKKYGVRVSIHQALDDSSLTATVVEAIRKHCKN